MRATLSLVTALLLGSQSQAAQAQYTATFIETSKVWGSVVADFNRDGHDDFFITGHDQSDRIWYWTKKGYKPAAQALPWVDRHDCDAADVNLDGLLDVYCAIGAEKGIGVKVNELWMQLPTGEFSAASGFGAEDPYGRGRRPVFLDFNHDGFPDLYVTNDATPRPDGMLNENRLFINQAGAGFAPADTIASGDKGYQCAVKGDFNQDGWDDLMVCYENGPGHLFLNNKAGNFTEVASPAPGVEWKDAKLVDMNGDGREDLVLVTLTNLFQIWINTGASPYFTSPAYSDLLPAKGVSVAVGDFNRDGRKDVYVVLQDLKCLTTTVDRAPDILYTARTTAGFDKTLLPQSLRGCGHMADVVDGDKILLENGGMDFKGPNYLLSW